MSSSQNFSEEDVKKLNEEQKRNDRHPYTCDRIAEECEVRSKDHTKDGVLIATTEGWVCPCGKYRQNWYHNE